MKVVVDGAMAPLERALVAGALASGHDVRLLREPLAGAPVPRGCRLTDELAGDVVVHVTGGLAGVRPDDLVTLGDLASCASGLGVPLLVLARSDLSQVERLLTDAGGRWTLQGATVLHEDVDALFAARVTDDELTVPLHVALQPVDAAEVADRAVRLLRTGPVGRVPDFGGPTIHLVEELAASWLRRRSEVGGGPPLRLVDAEAEGERWPGAWLAPRRTVGRRTWDEWLDAHRSATDPLDGGHQPGRTEALGRRPRLVAQP